MLLYRRDVDGLRAIAVGAVVLYHCGFARYFPGGFVGVDIFFVISGYLITGVIQDEIEHDKFSLLEFYNRRVRRIFPALLTVFISVLLFYFLAMMPSELPSASSYIVSSIFFVSNIFFYMHSGYFEVASATNPVLHTWSLSVEEQFYIFLPLSLYFLRGRSRKFLTLLVVAIAAVSLLLSQIMLTTDPSGAYYLLQSRAWELLLGSILGLRMLPPVRDARLANGLAVLGVALLAWSIVFISRQSPFPGLLAAPACIGAVLLIYSGNAVPTIVSRVLGFAPVRFVGLVSYSFYLWHWPVWVLGSEIFTPRTFVDRLVFIGISFLLAVISWQFIEKPFRTKPFTTSAKAVCLYATSAMTAVALVAVFLPVMSRAYWQVPDNLETIAAFSRYNPSEQLRTGTCFLGSGSANLDNYNQTLCLSPSSSLPNYLLVGDSHAAHLYPGLAADTSTNVMQATASGCKPTIDAAGAKVCTDLMKFIFNDFLTSRRMDVVMLSARWEEADLPHLLATVRKLRAMSLRVVVFGPIVEYDAPLPKILARSLYRNEPDLPAQHRKSEPEVIDKLMRQQLAGSGAEYISMLDAVCPDRKCTLWTAPDQPLQFDYGHLTAEGSALIMQRLRGKVAGSLSASLPAN